MDYWINDIAAFTRCRSERCLAVLCDAHALMTAANKSLSHSTRNRPECTMTS
jgi:hypothetical protein